MAIQITRDRKGARVIDGEILLSRLLKEPGPTDTLFDALAASISCICKGQRVGVLGFGAGGFVAPLRALECGCRLECVDLWAEGETLFRELSGNWTGRIEFTCADAVSWLRRRRGLFDLILEDLSEPHPEFGACKPWASIDELPRLIEKKLRPAGAAVFNLLPWPGASWAAVLAKVAGPWTEARLVEFDDYENRLLLVSKRLESAAVISRTIRSSLKKLGSSLHNRLRVRKLKSA